MREREREYGEERLRGEEDNIQRDKSEKEEKEKMKLPESK
jgi:hypothetical protein